ncbi:MAG: hypothetical protein GX639_01920 [Fibrobacter sp.]|nr:hypothetical protein [Fibrobacter sp.]
MLLTSPFLLFITIAVLVITGFITFVVNLVSKHKEQIRQYSEQIEDVHIASKKLKHQLSEIEKKNIILNRDIDKIQQQHQKHLDRLKPEYRKVYTQLMSTIDKLDLMTSKFHDSEDAFDSLLDDNRELEHELHELSVENLYLRDEIALLKCKVLEHKPKRNLDLSPQVDLKTLHSSTIHESLSSVLSTITLNTNVTASAVADNLGFIVAEKGQRRYTEGLAGIAASFDSLNTQIHSFIPIGELKQIIVTDINDVTVSAFPITVSDEKLVVMLLSAGTAPATSTIGKAVTRTTGQHNHSTTRKAQNSNHIAIAF